MPRSESFLKAKTVERIERLARRGYETRRMLAGGGEWVTFSRWNESLGKRAGIAPQLVLIELANTQLDVDVGDASVVQSMDGTVVKVMPFDVRRGDMFTIGEAGERQVATIELVYPPARGIQKAAFKLTLGGK